MVEEQFYQGLGSRRDEKSKRQGMKKLKAPEGRRKAGKLQGKKWRKKIKKPFRIEIRIRDISVRKLCTRSIFLNTPKRRNARSSVRARTPAWLITRSSRFHFTALTWKRTDPRETKLKRYTTFKWRNPPLCQYFLIQQNDEMPATIAELATLITIPSKFRCTPATPNCVAA